MLRVAFRVLLYSRQLVVFGKCYRAYYQNR